MISVGGIYDFCNNKLYIFIRIVIFFYISWGFYLGVFSFYFYNNGLIELCVVEWWYNGIMEFFLLVFFVFCNFCEFCVVWKCF